jgi:hypothetical protein
MPGSLGNKLQQVIKRSPDEISSIKAMDDAIHAAFLSAAGKVKDMRILLKIPEGIDFTDDELQLAGWIIEYAEKSEVTFTVAMERVFAYLKRYPKVMAHYTNGNANFAEGSSGSVNFAAPRGWSIDPERMAQYQKLRVYQAGNNGCSFIEAAKACAFE